MLVIGPPYSTANFDSLPDTFKIVDHLNGWDHNLHNDYLYLLDQHAQSQGRTFDIIYHQLLPDSATGQYKNLKIQFSSEFQRMMNFRHFTRYNTHSELTFKNFVCSFNGSSHVSRRLLTSILKKFNWFDPVYSSKNFYFTPDIIDGHLSDYLPDSQHQVYRNFFSNNDDFCQGIYSFGHNRYKHHQNIHTLESKLTDSFLHVVSETMATSYCPFITEKFLYSIVTRGLFLSYAQPGWHDYLSKYYGFKKYTRLFDYRFDDIQNPVERLVELMTMISKFSVLSTDQWRDLYLLEADTIQYNYDWYFSKNYLKCLEQHE
jgi:hypothetical protein